MYVKEYEQVYKTRAHSVLQNTPVYKNPPGKLIIRVRNNK